MNSCDLKGPERFRTCPANVRGSSTSFADSWESKDGTAVPLSMTVKVLSGPGRGILPHLTNARLNLLRQPLAAREFSGGCDMNDRNGISSDGRTSTTESPTNILEFFNSAPVPADERFDSHWDGKQYGDPDWSIRNQERDRLESLPGKPCRSVEGRPEQAGFAVSCWTKEQQRSHFQKTSSNHVDRFVEIPSGEVKPRRAPPSFFARNSNFTEA